MSNKNTTSKTTATTALISAAYQTLPTEIKNKFTEKTLARLWMSYLLIDNATEIDLDKFTLPPVYTDASTTEKMLLVRVLLEDLTLNLDNYTSTN